MERPEYGDADLDPDLQVLLSDLRAIGDAAPKSGAKNRGGGAYHPTRYLMAVENAARDNRLVDRVREWLATPDPQDGFNALVEVGRGDLTVEALVLNRSKPYAHRFDSADRAVADRRLEPFRERTRDTEQEERERRERIETLRASGKRIALPDLDESLRRRPR